MQPDPDASRASLDAAVRTAHRSVLGLLAACAVVIFTQDGDPDAYPRSEAVVLAVALAFATIVLKQLGTSRVMAPRGRVGLTLAGLVCGALLGLLAVWVAVDQSAVQPALGMALGSAILCLRPPPSLAPPGASPGARRPPA